MAPSCQWYHPPATVIPPACSQSFSQRVTPWGRFRDLCPAPPACSASGVGVLVGASLAGAVRLYAHPVTEAPPGAHACCWCWGGQNMCHGAVVGVVCSGGAATCVHDHVQKGSARLLAQRQAPSQVHADPSMCMRAAAAGLPWRTGQLSRMQAVSCCTHDLRGDPLISPITNAQLLVTTCLGAR